LRSGANRLYSPIMLLVITILAVAVSMLIPKIGVLVVVGVTGLILFLFFLISLYNLPALGIFATLVISFFAIGMQRYVDLPFGLAVDAMLILTLFILFLKQFDSKIDWSPAKNLLLLLAVIWYLWILFQILNPNQPVFMAWFYSMRGFGLYFLIIVLLSLLLFDEYKYLKIFLYVWALLSLAGTIKGIIQVHIGMDGFERAWLYGPGAKTHLLFGKIRYFSFYSDAAIFGGGQAQTGVMSTIVAIHSRKTKERLFFAMTAIASFYGMMISGTRGSMAVPLMGLATYLILTRQIRVIVLGIIAGAGVFYFFAFTEIGNANYNIRRMRTAFHPEEDLSARVRVENRMKLAVFMKDKPFGSGTGSSGNWAIRFRPNSFLANTPTDGWFTQIWVENGIVGLGLHLFILMIILLKGGWDIMFRIKNPELRNYNMALLCPLAGVLLASYSSTLYAQMPVGIINYISMSLLFSAHRYDRELQEKPTAN